MMRQLTWLDYHIPTRGRLPIETVIDNHISNGELNIGKAEWSVINAQYDQADIADAIKSRILLGAIELPIKKYRLQDAEADFKALIEHESAPIKSGYRFTRYDYSFDQIGYGRYIDESNVGNIASDYFQQSNRFACGSIIAPSPLRTWQNDKFLDGMLKALWSLKSAEVNSNTFRTCLALRKYTASQFKPAVAKSIYQLLGSQDVLDFSAGWGDRLCGFYSCPNTKSYIGIDPNRSVYEKYSEQTELYSRLNGQKNTLFICSPAEDINAERFKDSVDTVFTSPPYFNLERYSDDDSQSYKRYRKLDAWLEGFLLRAIDLSYIALKSDGYLAINISDVYSGHKINRMCDPMNEYIQSLGMEYIGMIGMRMAKRPNSKAAADGIFIEPIWIWKKK